MSRPLALRSLLLLVLGLMLSACDQLGIETPAQTSARQEAEGKAIGGACRHAGWALEDCYQNSPKVSKAAIYAGWRDMDAYMRENKLDTVTPTLPPAAKPTGKKKKAADGSEEASAKEDSGGDAKAEKPATESH